MVPPAAIPWPVFKKPYSIEPADVTTEEVGLFLHSLQHSTDQATFTGHLKNLRVRFHPDRWRGELLKVEDTEERERWERALVNTSQAISGFGNDEIEEVINGLSASYSPSTTGSEDVEKIFPGVRHRGIVGGAMWGEAPNDASPPISPDMGIGGYPRNQYQIGLRFLVLLLTTTTSSSILPGVQHQRVSTRHLSLSVVFTAGSATGTPVRAIPGFTSWPSLLATNTSSSIPPVLNTGDIYSTSSLPMVFTAGSAPDPPVIPSDVRQPNDVGSNNSFTP
ncbi:hypothetical protein HD554DRAFT_2181132 [Boletus coccyginus]|nr:hypothetical protein HD554DRAFT_2181132 [Boletus coccyginus]